MQKQMQTLQAAYASCATVAIVETMLELNHLMEAEALELHAACKEEEGLQGTRRHVWPPSRCFCILQTLPTQCDCWTPWPCWPPLRTNAISAQLKPQGLPFWWANLQSSTLLV